MIFAGMLGYSCRVNDHAGILQRLPACRLSSSEDPLALAHPWTSRAILCLVISVSVFLPPVAQTLRSRKEVEGSQHSPLNVAGVGPLRVWHMADQKAHS